MHNKCHTDNMKIEDLHGHTEPHVQEIMKIEIQQSELQTKKIFVATPMYGGQCAGMFTKACIDLATLCANYGVECRFFFIFNEFAFINQS